MIFKGLGGSYGRLLGQKWTFFCKITQVGVLDNPNTVTIVPKTLYSAYAFCKVDLVLNKDFFTGKI